MYVSMNRLKVPADYQSHLERAFGGGGERMKEVPGFLEFLFLAPTEGDEYIVFTKWTDEESFQNWTQSEAFKRAHSGTNQNSPVKSDLRNYHVKANS
ncbi:MULTISPECIES: antibiotic biosynthesis monooxygenase family protein [Brevibacillus]|jgi:heme-degrading monooxygenase HmoA|uniref:Antibiotic biosynthesis monooxygenase n=1 Tax=Brevibacillus parabrevis TaxID=54914 RepID=A0A4Y3PK88_BREPA|nr:MULTISPECIES: antibiotic biosynthesis monooxygenase [Brevibacillus]MBU8711180.1 antibiotic biosynthesis monooxygenase [Brevibacillus parabrevis]MDR4999647.1 antibiotic biosynthesis monooxygenase [Brevibacillus parabrevis]MED2253791.1 antibiotic biosynthesis monooxygenase [Brevibacillus parabrevis]NRQ53874.1 antibiotic biosynthesis monooxygenase [Brevibacillus sp. HD1.4A]RNB94555.1 antibiotic biosynthesis monooxygenase [Brevibacillus parabrevis]